VVNTWGSSPRPPGSIAAVREDGHLVGSVSGGCIEKQLAVRIDNNDRAQAFEHSISNDEAKRFGLPCGGQLNIVFELIENSADLKTILRAMQKRQRIARTIQLDVPNSATLEEVDHTVHFYFNGNTLRKVYGPRERILIIGAGQLSRFVAQFAKALDYDVVVCEPRQEFASTFAIPGCKLVTVMPDEAVLTYAVDANSVVLALTHDLNLDDAALIEALASNAHYVGALGSKANNERRRKRLKGIGVDNVEKLHGPVGLPIGSRTSAEIAISILAELVQIRNKVDASNRN